MKPETEEIEVEVVEVVDAPLSSVREAPTGEKGFDRASPGGGWQNQWQGRVKSIDMRWWPLWALIALIPLIAIAILIGICLVFLKLLGRLISAFSK